ncbi:hypothetical protein C8F04DRAFT_167052 [Mycena alexandri]|uniref:Arrestin C-terminal-like domain-containing protein n=1 Tax=Mycena alexandri TaxID=1745969 RepID=A0AAD6S040_9AGAR|nr:hypothetical protein C8F04DRAFT_1052915 [Mycena alexandri]KAJ7024020.1 hypothetical protein C8F04DRAFT_167052 [Mycena alexandri]
MVKNTLTIRLTEAAVFLRTDDNRARRRQAHDASDPQPGMLRGLLTLTIVKPIKITSIDLELQARSSTSWPEGIGARRIDIQEDHKLFSESIVFFRAGPAPRRNASVGPGIDPAQDDDFLYDSSQPATPRHDELQLPMSARAARGVSADSSYFHNLVSDEPAPPIPPYTPLPSTPTSSSHTSPSGPHLTRLGEHPAHALEDFRNALRAGLSSSHSISGDRSPNRIPSSASSFYERDESLSRRPSMDLPEVDESQPDALSGSSSPSRADARGRRARFSLTSVSSILRDVVHSGSPRVSKERSDSTARDSTGRGRTREKTAVREAASKERSILDKLTGSKEDVKDKEKEKSDSWKEFKKGTYTFPISFAIPPNSPPSMECNYGTVIWRLKANVHRPGAFASRMHATREVVVITAPMEDDTEGSENIVVERHWEQQLQYLISISGRSFPVGGVVPVSFTMMPMTKVKIHRVAIYLEEKVEYYSQMKRLARADPVMRLQLLSIKHNDKSGGPILPLDSNDVDALKKSPLLALTMPGDDLSELASEWMGPGPWTFHQELQLPQSCARLRFTNKNKRSNMTVTHFLKCVMRVERGDDCEIDAKTGKRKLYDIVVQTPVHILSCRCNPEWMSLPRYSTSFEDPAGVAPICPCEIVRRGGLERVITHRSSDSTASAAETSPIPGAMPSLRGTDSLFARNALFERLVSGQESELGEAPPAYE